MDNDFSLDLPQIFETIDTAEVITLRFAIIPQRLLLDMRTNDSEGPLLKVVPRAESVEDRFRSLKQLRPRFKSPQRIVAVWWPKRVETLVTLGVWDRISRRALDSGWREAALSCESVLNELRLLERREVENAVRGHGYEPVWPK